MWTAIVTRVKHEPALIIGLIQATIVLIAAFGLRITDPQSQAIVAFVVMLMSVITRQMVTPITK